MANTEISKFLDTAIPIILLIVAIVFVWYKFHEPFKKFFEWISSMFKSGGEKTVQISREIVYDM